MSGYQDFAEMFGCGVFVGSDTIAKRYPLQKALASLYIIPAFFRGVYYIPTERERKGHFIEQKQDFFTSLFDFRYGRKKWYWGLSTAARHYGIEWSATKILEVVARGKPVTVRISDKISGLEKKRSYRSSVLARYFSSLDINLVFVHKGEKEPFSGIKIDDVMGPVCTKERMLKDVERFISKVRDRNLKRVYRRILDNLKTA